MNARTPCLVVSFAVALFGCSSGGGGGGAPDSGISGSGGTSSGGTSSGGTSSGGTSSGGTSSGGTSSGGTGGAAGTGGSPGCVAPLADCDQTGSCSTNLDTDHDHCGSCTQACAFLSVCAKGACSAALDTDTNPDAGLVTDATRAYWFHFGTPSELRAVDHTTSTYQAVATLNAFATGLAVTANRFIAVSMATKGSEVWSLPKAGGTFELLGSNTDGAPGGNVDPNVAVSGGYAFWTGANGVYRVPLAGGTSELWVKTFCVSRMRADANTVYMSCYDGKMAVRKATDPPELNYGYVEITASADFALDASYLYYWDSGGLSRKPKSGGIGSVLIAGASPVTNGGPLLEVDDVNLYWGQSVGTDIPVFYAPNQPGAKGTALWDESAQVERIASGGGFVYWIDNAHSLFRTPQP